MRESFFFCKFHFEMNHPSHPFKLVVLQSILNKSFKSQIEIHWACPLSIQSENPIDNNSFILILQIRSSVAF